MSGNKLSLRQKIDQARYKNNESRLLFDLIHSTKVDWEAVKGVFTAASTEEDGVSTSTGTSANVPTLKLPDSLYHDGISKACLDSNVDPEALKLLLPVRIKKGLPTLLKIKFVMKAARCDNTTALRVILVQSPTNNNDQNQILTWNDQRGNTLLHLACAENGWNSAISYLLDTTLQQQRLLCSSGSGNNNDNNDNVPGLFRTNDKGQCPLWLALEGGANIAEILNHTRQQHLGYLKQNVELLIQVMAEYCTDMTALEDLLQDDPTFLDIMNSGNVAPLYFACRYQNPNMIRCLLRYQLRQRGEKRNKLLKKLIQKSSSSSQENTTTSRKAPLTMLILGVGRSDPGNSIECVQACQDMLGTFPVLHYAIEEALWPDTTTTQSAFAAVVSGQRPLQTISRIIDHWKIDLLSLDDKKRSIVSLLIMKQPVASRVPLVEPSIRAVFEEVLTQCPDAAFARDKRKRLPLHLACEAGWHWHNPQQERQQGEKHSREVLAQLVHANPSALEVMDPKFKVYPFALATDLTTIYNLLRYQPGVL